MTLNPTEKLKKKNFKMTNLTLLTDPDDHLTKKEQKPETFEKWRTLDS